MFRALTKDNLKQIVDMELSKVASRLKEKQLVLEVSDEAKDFIIEKGSSLDYGARPLRRAVEQHLEDAMSESLLKGEFSGKDKILVKVAEVDGEKKLVFDSTDRPAVDAPEPVAAGEEK